MTTRRFAAGLEAIPAATAWYLADLDKAQGRPEFFTHQSPLDTGREQRRPLRPLGVC
jgi:hypothetical protein